MSDLSAIRSRRRHRGTEAAGEGYHAPSNTTIDFEPSPEEQKQHGFQSHLYNPINKVFGTSTTQLWTSAQEAFSGFQPSQYIPTSASFTQLPVVEDEPAELREVEFLFFGKEEKVPLNMPSRDRTREFQAASESFQLKVRANELSTRPNRNGMIGESIRFNDIAKRIGQQLTMTCAKMERLAELAKKKSLFIDGTEVEGLSREITDDIKDLNRQIASLQEYSRRRGGQANSQQEQGHSNLVVVGLQSKLANVSKDFQTVLEVRTQNLKDQKTRRDKFSTADNVPTSLPTSSKNSGMRSRLVEDDIAAGGSVALDMDLLANHQSQQMMHADQSTAYAQSRSETMALIEGSVSELGQIFSQLARLVTEQGEMIERIDSNVEETSINIDAAHSEIVRYFHSISQNRWLMIKVFGVLMVFFIVFVMFLT